MPPPNKANIAHHANLAKQLILAHYPKKTVRIKALSGGISNFVYSVTTRKEELVVRISEQREKISFFLKEQWAIARAKEKGIPVPEILEVGNDIIPLPYMIARRVAGEEASHHPKRLDIIREVGRYAAIIHTIPTNGFGHMFDWSQNTLSKNETWKDYLTNELRVDERLDILTKYKMLPVKFIPRIRRILRTIQSWKQSPCLQHGDLRLKNVMVNKDGQITAIIDWDNCMSSIGNYWDTSIALHDLSIDAQTRYLEGYGIKAKQLIEMAPAIKVFNLLNYAPVIAEMVGEKKKELLDHYRARLHGALDMFSM